MREGVIYQYLADGVLVLHVAFVAFVIFGLIAVLIGGAMKWRPVRNPWFRWGHLASIGLVVAQAWLGVICPLTILENHLRRSAGQAAYEGSFIQHWLHSILFYQGPPWVFTLCYTLFGLAVVGSWVLVRPRSFRKLKQDEAETA